MPSVASYTYPQVPQQMQSPPQFPPQHQQSHHPTQAQQPPYALQMHQQLPSPHPAPWPSASVSLLPTQPHPYNPPPHSYTPLPFLPTPQQQFAQNSASPIHQPPQQVMQPGFQHLSYQQQPQHPQHPQVMLAYQQPLTPTPGMYHSSHSPPALSSTQAPGPNFVSAQPQLAPEPTHRDVLTRDLPAGLMMSKIEPDAEYYEPLPAYVSIPMKSDAISSTVLEHLAKFLSNSPCVGNGSEITEDNRNNANSIKNEGWGDGCLDDFYKSVAVKRRCAYSKEPVKSQKDSERRGRHSRGSESNSRMRTYARSRSRSRSRSRRRSSLHSYSRSLSRGRSRTRSWSRSPPYRSRNRKFSRSRNRDRSESRNISRSKSRDRSRSRGRESYR
ncbi:hypothetical protein BCR41DRAFT_77224 [Lobosporangium transversale]|uniref:Uncharacterized protein n=1 Tax=Lobosporangium transversale TaxID=64571 RepID=A0A1Y2GLE7_9FUNG|nr:hypothetical protein BCR41DRAFT_77224 [Lobosporangium transversale]ORZ14836.1 hypothetical protein BCR41DRAFT_77224 [Lobosporangium transversale]|eukprot:XP_021880968.1 hypothetical protein BCR41DRAFT_77224 [Lobosporangium transversale]